MIKTISRKLTKQYRHLRLRKKISGTSEKPRFVVFRSQKQIYVQVIDDHDSKTLVFANSLEDLQIPELEKKESGEQKLEKQKFDEVKSDKGKKSSKPESVRAPFSKKPTLMAEAVGQLAAKRTLEKGISQVVFDRGGFRYHGRVKAVAEGARKAGLQF
jgi:large subunit ribosomal protein L18